MRKFYRGGTTIAQDEPLQALARLMISEDVSNLNLWKVKLKAEWGSEWLITVERFNKDGGSTIEVIDPQGEMKALIVEHRATYGIFHKDTEEVHIPWYEFELILNTSFVNGECNYVYTGKPSGELNYETLLIDLAEFPRDNHDLNDWFLEELGLVEREQ